MPCSVPPRHSPNRPLQSVESLEVFGGERLLIANDNNYPFSDGRWVGRDKSDDTEMMIVHAPALR